jgi:hypothetical protein
MSYTERGETKEVAEIYWVKNRSEGQKLDYMHALAITNYT